MGGESGKKRGKSRNYGGNGGRKRPASRLGTSSTCPEAVRGSGEVSGLAGKSKLASSTPIQRPDKANGRGFQQFGKIPLPFYTERPHQSSAPEGSQHQPHGLKPVAKALHR